MWFLSVVNVWGGTLNVISNHEAALIELNGVRIATKGSALNYEIKKGSHLVQVKLNNDVVYSEQFQIVDAETKTIFVDNFVQSKMSPLSNKGADQLEVKRNLKSKGKFGIGLTYGVLPGISFRYRVNQKLGFEFTGVHFNFNSSENQDSRVSIVEGRGLYYLKDKMKYRMPATGYLTIGAGRFHSGTRKVGYADISMGMEFSFSAIKRERNPLFWVFVPSLAALDKVLRAERIFPIMECGYGVFTSKKEGVTDRYEGIIGRLGFRYYF